MIRVSKLSKTFRVPVKKPGLRAAVQGLFHREYETKHALREATFEVTAGETVGLIGANGAGKTTLVKILAGIVQPSSGQARILDFDPSLRENAFRGKIALIMGQKAQLWWDLPAADCFELLREIYRIPPLAFEERLRELTARLEVGRLMNTQIRRLSLGERMKMELIAALLHQPEVIFLDEPTIGLDFTAQRAIRDFLLDYRARHRPAILLTSHYLEDIEKLCSRVIVLRAGAIVYDGPLRALQAQRTPMRVLRLQFQDAPPSSELPPEARRIEGHAPNELACALPLDTFALSSARLLERLRPMDFRTEEEDVTALIEQLFRGGQAE